MKQRVKITLPELQEVMRSRLAEAEKISDDIKGRRSLCLSSSNTGTLVSVSGQTARQVMDIVVTHYRQAVDELQQKINEL